MKDHALKLTPVETLTGVFLFSEKVFIHVPAGSQIETGGKYHGH